MHPRPTTPNDPSGARAPLVILVAITATGPLALNILVPSLPGLQAVFATDYATVQLVLTVYLVSIAVGQLLYGPLSDRFGRRPVLLAGLGVYVTGSLACLLAPTIELLVAGRCVQAVGGCAGAVLARAIIADLYEREEAASMLAYVIMAMVVVPMLAPAVGGFLDQWLGWWAGFAVVLVFGILVLAACWRRLEETHHERAASIGVSAAAADVAGLLGSSLFLAHALQVAFTTAVFFGFLAGAPYVMVELLGRTPAEYGLYFVLVSSTFMAGNYLAGRLTRRIGGQRMVRIGTTIALTATLALLAVAHAGAVTPLALFGLMGVVGIGNGLSVSNGLSAAIAVDRTRIGAASGVSGFLQMGMGAAASWLVGSLMDESVMPLVATMVGCAAAAAACHWLGSRLEGAGSRQS